MQTSKIIKFYLQTCWFVHTTWAQWLCEYLSISYAFAASLYLLCKFMAKYLLHTIATAERQHKNFHAALFPRVREKNKFYNMFFWRFQNYFIPQNNNNINSVDDSFFSCGHLTLCTTHSAPTCWYDFWMHEVHKFLWKTLTLSQTVDSINMWTKYFSYNNIS